VTLRQNVPTSLADALGLAAGAGRSTGAVLSLPNTDAETLVSGGYASFGNVATSVTNTSGFVTVTLRGNVPTDLADAIGLGAGAGRQTGAVVNVKPADAETLVSRGLAAFGSAASDAANSPTGNPRARKGSATLDFPAVAAAGAQSLTINVPGAAVGQAVSLALPAAFPVGLVANGFVSAAGVVTVRVQNITAAPIDPPSATYGVVVLNPGQVPQ
jgi:hypothetical protein